MSRGVSRSLTEFSAASAGLATGMIAYGMLTPVWAVPLVAVGTWGLTRLLFRPFVRPRLGHNPHPLEPCDFDAEIGKVVKASQRIQAIANQAGDPVFRQRGMDVSFALNHVIAHFREDPDDIFASQKFLAVYIERTLAIMARYVQLEGLATPQADQVRRKVRDELLPVLVKLCETHLQRITYDDLRALETDVDVLYKAINLEGL